MVVGVWGVDGWVEVGVSVYVIFYPDLGLLELYNLTDGRYVPGQPNVEGRHWIGALGLFLEPWRGWKENRAGLLAQMVG
jgi:hypothetical protein